MSIIGREFVALVSTSDKSEEILVIEVLSVFEEIFFDVDSYAADIEDEQNHPGIITNNHRKFLSLLYMTKETREISRCCEHDLIFDVTGLNQEQQAVFLEKALKEKENVSTKESILITLQKQYEDCIDIGYKKNEAIDQIYKIIDEEHSGDKVLKEAITIMYDTE